MKLKLLLTLITFLILAPAGLAQGPETPPGEAAPPALQPDLPFAADHILVRLAEAGAAAALPQGAELIFGDWYRVPTGDAASPQEAMARLEDAAGVEEVELDTIVRLSPGERVGLTEAGAQASAPDLTPNDPYYNLQWHFPAVQAPAAWDRSSGQGVVVAVIDTGVARGSDLECRTLVDEFNAITNQSGQGVATDDEGHGTHVAGTIAQCTNNGAGVAGLAHNATLMPVKVLDSEGSGLISDIAQGVDWARSHNARVINLSLGMDCGSSGWPSCSSSILNSALAAAAAADIVIVAAAGNANQAVVGFPANHPDVMAVSAVEYNLNRAPYSSYGSALSVAAPGGNTHIDRNNDGYVDGVLQQTFGGQGWGYYFFEGTSMATPHVTGAVAMLRSARPDATRQQIRQALQATALDRGPAGFDNEYGYGVIQIDAALSYLLGNTVTPPGDFSEPANEAQVTAPVWLRVQVTNPNDIAHVQFTSNGAGPWTAIFDDTQAPFEVLWQMAGVPNNQRFLIGAEIYDKSGNRVDRARWITKLPGGAGDTTAPSGDFTAPAAGAQVTAPVWLRVSAQDNAGGSGMAKVRFTTNATGQWQLIAEDTTAPFEIQWNMAGVADNASFMIGAELIDNAGNRADRVRTISKRPAGGDTTPPTGDFTAPAANAQVTAPVWLRVSAQDNAGGSGVAKVRFTSNGTGQWRLLAEDTSAPYEFQWDLAGVPEATPFLIGAEIYDAAGNRADRARWIVRRSNDTTPPSGDFSEPASGARVNAPVWLRAQVQDNTGGSGIDRVLFTTNATGSWTMLAADSAAPYEFQCNMAGAPENTPFLIGLQIYDRAGNRTDRVRWIIKNGASSTLQNGNFEQGRNVGWQEYSQKGWQLVVNDLPGTTAPHGGQWAAWLGGDHNEVSSLWQNVAIPAGASTLRFWYWIASADVCGYDTGGVIIDTTVVATFDLCDSNDTDGWVQRTLNLSAYAGRTVRLQFRVETDGSLNSNFFLDDVSLGATALGDGPDATLAPAPIFDEAEIEATRGEALTPGQSSASRPAPQPAPQPAPGPAWPRLWPSSTAPKE